MIESVQFHPVRALRARAAAVEDVETAVCQALAAIQPVLADIPRGARVAVTCGSRGIDRMAEVLRACCHVLRHAGARPFIVPAMGSHGGATAEGQLAVLAGLGITEESVRAPIVSSMETVSLGSTPEGVEVFMNRQAWEAGRVLAVNRVKPHTDFDGEVESGLMKVLAVGLGKLDGARSFHRNSLRLGFDRVVLAMGRHILNSGRVLAGLGLVENDRHALALIRACAGRDVEQLDRSLLACARQFHPKLPFAELDLLVVDRMGKNISGTGMDTKVIGRSVHPEHVPPDLGQAARIRRIYVRDLTAESEGNAIGVGLADVVHERLARKVNLETIYTNAQTSLAYAVANLPMSFSSDRAAIDFLLGNLGSPSPERLRAVWIRDTLSVTEFLATPACARELAGNAAYQIEAPAPMQFDAAGDLMPVG